jgi:hypothetical protein
LQKITYFTAEYRKVLHRVPQRNSTLLALRLIGVLYVLCVILKKSLIKRHWDLGVKEKEHYFIPIIPAMALTGSNDENTLEKSLNSQHRLNS